VTTHGDTSQAGTTDGYLVVSGQPFDETVDFFTTALGMRLERISPADDPAAAIVTGHGLTLLIA